jgi:hypothetical protein
MRDEGFPHADRDESAPRVAMRHGGDEPPEDCLQ